MDRHLVPEELESIIRGYLDVRGLELVELICRRQGRDLAFKLLVDKPKGGITLEECTSLNREIVRTIEERGILKENYFLEISSPGLDRPLKTKNDFLRCLDRKAHIFLIEAKEGKVELEGIVSRVEDEKLCIDQDGIIMEIPLVKISRAKQIIEHI